MNKHPFLKRAFAAATDILLIALFTVFIAMPMSSVTGFKDARSDVEALFARLEATYGVSFHLSPQELQGLTDEQMQRYEQAFEEFRSSEEDVETYKRMVMGSYTTVLGSILIAVMILEFAVPMFFGNGQTLGKKMMGLVVIKSDGIPVDTFGMLVRALLGKFLVELAVPVFTVLAVYNGNFAVYSLFAILVLFLAQAVCMGFTKDRRLLHDFLSGTHVVAEDSEEFGM